MIAAAQSPVVTDPVRAICPGRGRRRSRVTIGTRRRACVRACARARERGGGIEIVQASASECGRARGPRAGRAPARAARSGRPRLAEEQGGPPPRHAPSPAIASHLRRDSDGPEGETARLGRVCTVLSMATMVPFRRGPEGSRRVQKGPEGTRRVQRRLSRTRLGSGCVRSR